MDHSRLNPRPSLVVNLPSVSPSSSPSLSPISLSPSRHALPNVYDVREELNEKVSASSPQLTSPNSPRRYHSSSSRRPSLVRPPTPIMVPTSARSMSRSQTYTRPRGLRIANLLRPWIPIILYVLSSLAFLVAITMYKSEVFARLDELSSWLKADEQYGHAVLFLLIFLTTIPPFPLYSTLITLAGYTFGPWTGAVISYFSALAGALVVFVVSRSLLRESITRWLDSACTLKRVIRAVEKRPKLLFLIRLAPYPYNVMNCLLAAAPTLTLRTYTICTALSLFKVIIHTSLGASIHSFKDFHMESEEGDEEDTNADTVARTWTAVGIVLCLAILIYLSIVARKAVDEELDDDDEPVRGRRGRRIRADDDEEETVAFLSPRGINDDLEAGDDSAHRSMAESPFRTPLRLSIDGRI